MQLNPKILQRSSSGGTRITHVSNSMHNTQFKHAPEMRMVVFSI